MTIFYESESKKILKSKLKTDRYSVLHSPLTKDVLSSLELFFENR